MLVVAPAAEQPRPVRFAAPAWSALTRASAAAVLAVAAAVVVGTGLERVTRLPNLSMLFLLAVLLCAMRFGLWSAVASTRTIVGASKLRS